MINTKKHIQKEFTRTLKPNKNRRNRVGVHSYTYYRKRDNFRLFLLYYLIKYYNAECSFINGSKMRIHFDRHYSMMLACNFLVTNLFKNVYFEVRPDKNIILIDGSCFDNKINYLTINNIRGYVKWKKEVLDY